MLAASRKTHERANSTGRTVAVRPLPSFLCDSVSRLRTVDDSFIVETAKNCI